MLSLLKRYRDLLVLGGLLVYPFVTFLTSGHRGRPPHLLDRLVLAVASPLEGALSWAVDGLVVGARRYLYLVGAEEAYRSCLLEKAEARAELNSMRELAAENERLKRLLGYAEHTPAEEIPARIVGVNPAHNFLSVRLNRGEADGVRAGMPVLTAEGVVGHVQRVVGSYADVVLATDPASKLGVLVQRTRARGTATGAGGAKPLLLENVLRSEDVEEGDLVITAGTDGIFPKGLVVGRVTAVQRNAAGMFLHAGVLPSVELWRLEEVLVAPAASPQSVAAEQEARR